MWHIVLPQLKPATLISIVVTVVGSLRGFYLIAVKTAAGPWGSTGYSLAMQSFKLNFLVFAMFIAGNFVPYQILMIPVRNISIEMGMYNTHLGLIIFYIAFQTGF